VDWAETTNPVSSMVAVKIDFMGKGLVNKTSPTCERLHLSLAEVFKRINLAPDLLAAYASTSCVSINNTEAEQ
jgi:hypothetical protein